MASPSSSTAPSVSSDPPSPLSLPFSPSTDGDDDGGDDEDEDTRASPQPGMSIPDDPAPLNFPHLKPDSNAKVQVGRGLDTLSVAARHGLQDAAHIRECASCTTASPT